MKRICFLTDSIFSIGGVQRVTAVIAKELAMDYDVTIVTFDDSSAQDTSLYDLHQADIHYVFFSYPETNKWIQDCCKAYSALYRKMLPQNRTTSDWYAHSSFPSPPTSRHIILKRKCMCSVPAGKGLASCWLKQWPTACPLSAAICPPAWRSWATSVSILKTATSKS